MELLRGEKAGSQQGLEGQAQYRWGREAVHQGSYLGDRGKGVEHPLSPAGRTGAELSAWSGVLLPGHAQQGWLP